MHHISGLIYNGLWVNGFPEIMASKLKIVFDNNSEIDKKKKSPKDKTKVSIFQGIGFTVSVECQNESNRVILGSVSCVCIGCISFNKLIELREVSILNFTNCLKSKKLYIDHKSFFV